MVFLNQTLLSVQDKLGGEEGDCHTMATFMPTRGILFKWLPLGSWPEKPTLKGKQINKARAWAVSRQIIYPSNPGSFTYKEMRGTIRQNKPIFHFYSGISEWVLKEIRDKSIRLYFSGLVTLIHFNVVIFSIFYVILLICAVLLLLKIF